MPSIYQIKPAFQGLLRPIVRILAKIGVTANAVTLIACALSVALGIAFFLHPREFHLYWILPLFLFVRMALNAIDGMLAREHNMKTNLGAFLNELTDVLSDAFLYFPFALALGIHISLAFLFVLLSALSEMTGVVAVQVGASRRYDGPMGKSDRAFFIGLISLISIFTSFTAIPLWNWVFIILSALVLFTIINRIKKSLHT